MKTITKILGGAFVVVAISVIASNSVFAYKGDYSEQGPDYSPERHTEMTEVMNHDDYESWSRLMEGRGRVTQVVNEENFSRFTDARRLAREGKYEEADAIREELGLGAGGERVGLCRGVGGEGRGQNKQGR